MSRSSAPISVKGLSPDAWLRGDDTPRNAIRAYVLETHNTACSSCGLSEWLGSPIALEIDHIDGNAANNLPGGLRPLCPNCHSQTETYKAKNRGNGRHVRRERYSLGKSF